MSTNRQRCFVILPFSKTSDEHTEDYWTEHFEHFLKPLIEENSKLEAHRSEALRGDIVKQIITDLVISPVVVADLTDNNPNVYWELGVRQSFKHGTITIAEEGTRLPFDIGAKGTLFYYPKDHLKNADFCKRFKAAIEDCLSHPERPDSHVLETLSGRGTLFGVLQRDEAIRRLDAVLSESSRNLGILRAVIIEAQNNQKDPKNRKFITGRLRPWSVELLITNRYVDEDQSFYKLAETYLDGIVRINAQLELWAHSPHAFEKWILRLEKSVTKDFNDFRSKVRTVREELGKKL